MSERAVAVCFTYVPAEDKSYHMVWTSDDHDDPLSAAHAFRASEEERGDFADSIWAVNGNDAAAEIRKVTMLRGLGMEP